MKKTLILLAAALLASGCSSSKVKLKKADAYTPEEFAHEKETLEKTNMISPGFLLRIRHSSDAQISGEYRVSFKGMVKLPYNVTERAAGFTTDQLKNNLEKAYSAYFKARNSLSVEIVGREYLIEVRGLVQKPGVYTVKLDSSVEEVIALSGGIPGGASDSKSPNGTKAEYIRIVRPDFMLAPGESSVRWVRLTDYFLKYDVRNEILWRGGEELFFQVTGDADAIKSGKTQTVEIMGEVHTPGEYPVQPNLSILAYLALAGGPTSTADLGNVVIVTRGDADSSRVTDVSKGDELAEIGPGDIILVRSTQVRPGFFERLGPTLLSLGGLIVSIAVVIIAL